MCSKKRSGLIYCNFAQSLELHPPTDIYRFWHCQ
nr:MAG TPA: hypothetical protein [Caudoviricetes sp.]